MTKLGGLSESEVVARRARGLGNAVQLQTSRSYLQILRQNAFTFINRSCFRLALF
jgi:cation-transporting ATPase E